MFENMLRLAKKISAANVHLTELRFEFKEQNNLVTAIQTEKFSL